MNSSAEMPLSVDADKVKSVTEGKATVLLPQSVFYNPVQEFNRDLTIAVINNFIRQRTTDSSVVNSNNVSKHSVINVDADQPDGSSSMQGVEGPVDLSSDTRKKSIHDSQAMLNADCQLDSTSSEVKPPSAMGKGIRILEGLAASGLRSVRFALEIPGVREVIANDFDRRAVEFIRHNSESNGVANLVTASCADASMIMYANRRGSNRFDIIDLDPYGSPAQFLDAGVQSVADGGILCVTCTDMAVLCGNAAETCLSKYGAVSLRAPFCHEMALRILLQSVASHAARHQRYIEPLLSLSVDFYIRVFVRLHSGQRRVKDFATHVSSMYHCRRCGAFTLQPLMTKTGDNVYVASSGPPVGPQCSTCGGRNVIAGPVWSAPIHNVDFVRQVFDAVSEDKSLFPSTRDRIMGSLSVVLEELPDCPLYYVGDDLCGVVHCESPGFLPFRSALLHAGYKVSLSHAKKNSIKTDASITVIWDILRCWVRIHPVSEHRLQDGSTAKNILSKQPEIEANFELHPDANPSSRTNGLVRYQMNPDKDWGPKTRATRSGRAETVADRRTKGEIKADCGRKKRKHESDLKKFPCRKFLCGNCDRGDQCKYSHEDISSAD